MKKLFSIFLLAAAALSADPVTTQVTLVNAGPLSDGAYYVGPYTLSINGQNYAALCVDFLHDSTPGPPSWTAYVNTINDYSKVYHPDNLFGYAEEAYLYTLITNPNVSDDDRISIQHAAWNITDSNYTIDSAAQKFVDLAKANYGTVNLSDFQVLSDVNHTEQEFLVATPEPGSFATLGGGLLLGIGFVRRNRKKAASSSQIS